VGASNSVASLIICGGKYPRYGNGLAAMWKLDPLEVWRRSTSTNSQLAWGIQGCQHQQVGLSLALAGRCAVCSCSCKSVICFFQQSYCVCNVSVHGYRHMLRQPVVKRKQDNRTSTVHNQDVYMCMNKIIPYGEIVSTNYHTIFLTICMFHIPDHETELCQLWF